jgi:aminoglycoside 3-N-acetyltransferase
MGVIPELFRTWPGVLRSAHPYLSFAAYGPQAAYLTADHLNLEMPLGDDSPVGRLYELDGYVLLLGVGHDNNTSLHLAEQRAAWPGKRTYQEGTAMLVNGERHWVAFEMLDLNGDDFATIGDSYEAEYHLPRHQVGRAETRFLKQRPLVDYAVQWMECHRNFEE